jgi:uncharacterized membrane protein
MITVLLIIICAALFWLRSALKDVQRRLAAAELGQADLRAQLDALRRPTGDAPPQLTPGSAPMQPLETAPAEPTSETPRDPTPQAPVSVTPETRSPTRWRSASVPPTGPAPDPDHPRAPQAPSGQGPSLEETLGTRWAVWVGTLALALGGLLLVRYSIEHGLIGPGLRVTLGACLAFALAGAGEWLRRQERAFELPVLPAAHIPSALTGAGTVVALGTIYAAHALYGFIGPAFAFMLLGGIALAALAAAALHGPALAGIGLLGALAAPALVSSSEPNPWPVVMYLAVVAAAAYGLARLRQWLWLAGGVVMGAVVWGLLLLLSEGPAAQGWLTAVMTHTLAQLALAAFFMGWEPHIGRTDEEAAPDPIGHLALAALTALVLVVLMADTAGPPRPVVLTLIAAGILCWVGLLSAPVAGALLMAGVAALGMMATWPGLKGPVPLAPPYMREPGEVLQLPASVETFLTFAIVVPLTIAFVSGWRLLHGATLPAATAGLLAAAATLPPLTAFVLAWLRVTQFDHSIPFAAGGAMLAALLAIAAETFVRAESRQPGPALRLGTGAIASAGIAALALALTCGLDRGYLTVALALAALGTAYVSTRREIPILRYVVAALGGIVLVRIAIDPRIMGTGVGTTPIFNWLLFGYGVPAVAFAVSAHLMRKRGDDLAVRLSDGLAVLFTALLIGFQIRHMLNGGDPLAARTDHVELGLQVTASLGLSLVLSRLDLSRANPVFRLASLALGVIGALVALIGLGIAQNPLVTGEAILGRPWASSLLLAFLLPGVVAGLLARTARGVRPPWYVNFTAVTAVLLFLGFATLEVRHVFQGPIITWTRGAGGAEQWAYSAAWLALGLLFLAYGILLASKPARVASAALVLLSVLKVFLFDLQELSGLWRALSFITLGLVLIGIGLVYQRLLFAHDRSTDASEPPRAA